MPTVVRDLMSAPAVTCEAGTSLAEAAHVMRDAGIGSVIVTERTKVAGILTERDLLRAAAAATAASAETVEKLDNAEVRWSTDAGRRPWPAVSFMSRHPRSVEAASVFSK